jgi:hypothetical protein
MTQVLISGMAVTNYGGKVGVEDLSVKLMSDTALGDSKYAGECSACGKWAGAIAARLHSSDVKCHVDFYREWRRKMWERNTYDAVLHVMGVVRSQPTTVAEVAMYYEKDTSDILWEMSQLLRGWKALTLMYGFEERIFGTAEGVGKEMPTTLISDMYPYIWGNTVFLQSKTFTEYLNYAQEEFGFLPGIELPKKMDEDFSSNMRQGNLRADGVV